jgi:EAL domain-containing protein (putative c-di-GMP-specific phosphodiesterase class I)
MKIDRSFVAGMADDLRDEAIVRHSVDLGRSLGLRVVAEGVETPEVHERLAAMGCDQGQGYFYSRPIPTDEFERWLEQRRASGGATVTPIPVDPARSAAAA